MLLKKLWLNLKKIPAYIAIKFIYLYMYVVSPFFSGCRFTPTCSRYAVESYKTHNFFFATYLVVKRILRCNPWGGSGYDCVPKNNNNKENSKRKEV